MKRRFPGPELKVMFWKAAIVYNLWEHEMAIAQLQEASPAAHAWLLIEPKQHWYRYLFDPEYKAPDNNKLC